jgi:hypothetical protein
MRIIPASHRAIKSQIDVSRFFSIFAANLTQILSGQGTSESLQNPAIAAGESRPNLLRTPPSGFPPAPMRHFQSLEISLAVCSNHWKLET